MGALNDGHYDLELENTLKLCVEEEEEPEIQAAVRVLLQGLGEDVNREGIKKTPLRVAKAFRHATKGYKQNVTDIIEGAIFPEAGLDNNKIGHAGGAGGLVIVRDLDLFSYCESCLLPFQVKCHVGYVPSGQQVVGLSKLSRVADVFSKRLQDPQRLANEVCSALQQSIKSAGTAVILHCRHIHFSALDSMFLDSSSDGWIEALVASGTGIFDDQEADIWGEFFSLLRLKRSLVDKIEKRNLEKHWCPSQSKTVNNIPLSMINAVTSILKSLGEDPLRKELIDTPTRFLNWMINFRNCKVEMNLNICNKMVPRKPYEEVKYDMPMHSALSLPFWSQCEHHLLPFHGAVHIGYFSVEGVDPIRKSFLQSIVHFYGFKLQVQERLTRQIAETVAPLLGGDVIVVAEASHMCMIARGVEKFGSSTATVAVLGRFSVDAKARALFLESLPDTKDC